MKKIALSQLKQLDNVNEVTNSKMTSVKGGCLKIKGPVKIVLGIMKDSLGFIPPPGI